jgi:lysophospholipase L1-like esterase
MKPYGWFKCILFPFLPFLIYEAAKIRRNGVRLPALSEHQRLGLGEKKLIILGESTAAGVGASSLEKTLIGNFARLVGEGYTLENLGRNGITIGRSFSLFNLLKKDSSEKITGVLLFFGANDCFRLSKPIQFGKDLENLISAISADFSPDWIYLSDIPPVDRFPAFSVLMRKFLKIQRSYLQKEMIRLASQNEKIIFDPLSLNLEPDFFSKDKIHPSDKGYLKIAEFALQSLEKKGWIR